MKKSALLFILALSMLIIKAQSNDGKDPFMTKSFSGQTVNKAELQTSGGNINVAGGNGGNYRLEVYVKPNNTRNGSSVSKEELQKRLDENYDLTVSVQKNKLTEIANPKKNKVNAIAKPKKNNMDWRKSVSVSFKLFVQQNITTDLSTSGGNITLSNLSGNQEFRTSGGNLDIENLAGRIRGRTSGGNIDLTNVGEDIDLSTSGGNITAEKCNGKMKLATSGGSLRLSALKGDIDATTSGGSVHGSNIEGDL